MWRQIYANLGYKKNFGYGMMPGDIKQIVIMKRLTFEIFRVEHHSLLNILAESDSLSIIHLFCLQQILVFNKRTFHSHYNVRPNIPYKPLICAIDKYFHILIRRNSNLSVLYLNHTIFEVWNPMRSQQFFFLFSLH